MKLKMILFDLDGTLLPMNQEMFTKAYFQSLAEKMAPLGFDPDMLVQGIWAGIGAMVKNDNRKRNEEVFWETFNTCFGNHKIPDKALLEEYYRTDFQKVAEACGYNEKARKTVEAIREMGYRTVLATNPIFPAIATESRIRWAGLEPTMFELRTTYENSGFCKPNPNYYEDILQKVGCQPAECLMVGNDVGEDMVAQTIGMEVFLLKDCLINKKNVDISAFPSGSFEELLQYLSK